MPPAARYHRSVARGPAALPRRGLRGSLPCALLLLPCPFACVEIDPSYADSITTTGQTSDPSTSSDASSSDGSTAPPSACECAPLELCEAGACTQPSRVLFVNLDGVTTTFGSADASQNVEGLYEELAGTWDPYGADEATRQTLLSLVEEHWAPFRVVVTDTRPPAGPYLMAVVTASPPPAFLEGAVYVAYPDCGETIAQDVSFVFAAPGDPFGVAAHARWVSGAIGRGLGLRRNDASDDIMGLGDRFAETCHPSMDPACAAHHPELCNDDPMQQSSYGELAALLGTRG
jgi:hypothetical protein